MKEDNPNSKLKYWYDELAENYDDGFWWRNRIQQRIVGPVQQVIRGNDGIDVMEEDWDNLLVLDSCRYDYFEQVAEIETFDEYKRVESRASATPEWVQKNFSGGEFGDTVYVNANPWVSRHSPGAWHDVYDVWATDYDEERATVMADVLVDSAREADSEYPNKRLVVHFNQPHGPYVGDIPLEFDRDKARGSGEALEKGVVDEEDFRAAYRSNLEYVLPYATDLARDLEGKTVITADHGELFGKRLFPIPIKAYAHPIGLRDPELTIVPWAVIEDDERKEIVDEGTRRVDHDTETADQRLRDLGYKV